MDKAHGRVEKRTVEVMPILTVGQQWKGLKQGLRVTRERTVKGKKTVEVVHAITSLSGAGPAPEPGSLRVCTSPAGVTMRVLCTKSSMWVNWVA